MAQPRAVCSAAVDLIKHYEGIPMRDGLAYPYLDPVGIWTIGYGHAIRFGGRFLRGNADLAQVKSMYPDGLAIDKAEALLDTDLLQTGAEVLAMVTVQLTDNQYGALLSFTFNLGSNNLHTSTLLKDLNANQVQAAANQFTRWCYAGGKVVEGLVERRNAERALFLTQ